MSQAQDQRDISAQRKPARKPAAASGHLRVAVDDGYAQVKLYGEAPDGSIRQAKIPTIIRPARAGTVVDFGGEAVGLYRTSEGESFVCSDQLRGEETRFPDFHLSQMNRVIVRHALISAGYGDTGIELFTSLPVDEYFNGGQVNRERLDAKSKNIRGDVESVPAGRPQPAIHDVKVGCQAIAAYFDLILDDDGREASERHDAVAVVDIGGSTTDVAVVLGGSQIDNSVSGTVRLGVLDLQRDLATRLVSRFNFEPTSLDAVLRTRSIKAWGDKVDVGEQIDAAVAEISSQLSREITRRIGTAGQLDKVLFVGGGGNLFTGLVKHWKNGVLAPDPEFANARGLLKYGRMASRIGDG